MIRCPTCAQENDEFATVCSNCRAFLQNRVPNLNLFETSWGILESPRSTFRTIALAEHKNYAFFLFCGFGLAVSFSFFWLLKLGAFFDTLMDLLPVAFGGGIVLGALLALLLPLLFHAVVKALGTRQRLRQSYAILAYSLVPVVLSVIILLPIELMTFGMYLFTSNPDPAVIKPGSWYTLASLDAICGLWAVYLAAQGTRVVHGFSVPKAVAAVAVVLLVGAAALYAASIGIPVLLAAVMS